jgi:hypothetical protein
MNVFHISQYKWYNDVNKLLFKEKKFEHKMRFCKITLFLMSVFQEADLCFIYFLRLFYNKTLS